MFCVIEFSMLLLKYKHRRVKYCTVSACPHSFLRSATGQSFLFNGPLSPKPFFYLFFNDLAERLVNMNVTGP